MGWRRITVLLLAAVCAVSALASTPVRIVGSDLLGPRFREAIEKFASEGDFTITLDLEGTRAGREALGAARADLGLFLLPPTETPLADNLFVSRPMAYQPLVFVVPRSSPIRQVTHDQIRGIFTAVGAQTASTWGDVGQTGEWRGRSIAAHAIALETALAVPFARSTLFNGASLKPTVQLAPDWDVFQRRMLAAENSIGLSTAVPVEGDPLRALAIATSVSDAAFLPTAENLADGSYTLRLPLYLTVRRSSTERLLPLLRFLLGDEAAEALVAAQFQPLPIGARNQLIFELEELR